MRKRLCVVGPSFHFLSGLSVYTHNLATALGKEFAVSALLMRALIPRRLYPGGARVGHTLTSLDYDGVPHFDGINWYWGSSLVRGLAFFGRRRPEVLVLQWWTAAVGHTYLLLALLARATRASVVLEIHEVQDVGEASNALARRYGRLVLRLLLRLAQGVLLHHEHDHEALRDQGFRLDGKRIATAPHGPYVHLSTVAAVPPPEFPGDPLSAEVGSCRNLLYFGVIRQYKGLDELIEAFSALPRPVAERLVLTIVGETWEGHTAPLERLAASPHRDRVRLVNRYVTDAEAAHVFAEADVVVLPYRRASASGPLHIAMAEGLPVIVSDVPALVAAIGTYEGAELVPVGDVAALSGAVARAADRPRRRFAPSGDWRRTVEAYQALVSDREPAGSGDVAAAISPLEITRSAQ